MLLGPGQIEGVHYKPDIGRVLTGHLALGDLDKLKAGLVEGVLVVGVPDPVGVRFLDHDLSLFHEALDDQVDIELPCFPSFGSFALEPKGDIFKVYEHREGVPILFMCHYLTPLYPRSSGQPDSSLSSWPRTGPRLKGGSGRQGNGYFR